MLANEKLSEVTANLLRKLAPRFFTITHTSFTFLGLSLVFIVIALCARPEVRQASEAQLIKWLQDRQSSISSAAQDTEAAAYSRSNVTSRQDVSKQQAAVVRWLSKKYSVAPEPLGALVAQVYETGTQAKLDPILILAIMAIESGFNPFAQSSMGAQGLMQVMTRVHRDKYENFGGKYAAFHPVTNMRVGVRVLQDCIRRSGSLERGLKCYVGASDMEQDGGYTTKVLAEQGRLSLVANGRIVPVNASFPVTTAMPPIRKAPEVQQPEKVASLDHF